MEATDPSSVVTSTLATDYAPDIPKNDGIYTQPSATTAMTTSVSGSHGSARRVRMDAPAANDNEQSTDDGVDVYHDERSDHFTLTSPEAGRLDSATHADAVQGGSTASLFRLPNGQLITSKNTIPSHDNRVDAVQGHGGKDINLYRLPNGPEVTAKNTLQSHDVHNRRRQQVGSDNNASIPITIFVDAHPQPTSVRGSDNYNPLTPIIISQAAVENGPALTTGAPPSNADAANSNGANQKGYTRLAVAVIGVGLLVTAAVVIALQLTGSDATKSELSPSQTATKDTVPPSQSVSLLPQQSPTPAPTQTFLQTPTSPPTMESRATSITNFINGIKLSNGTLAVPLSAPTFVLSTSAEEAALAWLVYKDPLQLSPGTSMSEFRLQQRYALLTLFLQIPEFSSYGAAESECEWLYTESCSNTTEPMAHVTGIRLVVDAYFTMPSLGATLPPDLGLLTNLELFSLSGSVLTGDLPSSLGRTWANLTAFYLYDNARLTGSLPSTLGTSWTNLATFDVYNNALTGSLPPSLGTTWTNLESFDVSGNALTGSLPLSLGTTWTNLEDFDVSQNGLKGAIPNALASNWNNLQEAYFYNNSLVGSIPSGYCSIANLTLLADCQEVACPCCTYCCSDSGEATTLAAARCVRFDEDWFDDDANSK